MQRKEYNHALVTVSTGGSMIITRETTIAIVGLCSDPRFNIVPGPRIQQLRGALGVDFVVMLSVPGIVAKYQNQEAGDLMTHIHRVAWEDNLMTHYKMHNPCVVGIASHEGCGGFDGNMATQRCAAVTAAHILEDRLRTLYGVTLDVVPLFEQRLKEEQWRVCKLNRDMEDVPFEVPPIMPVPIYYA